MPKKNDEWMIGMPKGPIGPFLWQVWVKGSRKPIRVIAFDLRHIKNQLEGKKDSQNRFHWVLKVGKAVQGPRTMMQVSRY